MVRVPTATAHAPPSPAWRAPIRTEGDDGCTLVLDCGHRLRGDSPERATEAVLDSQLGARLHCPTCDLASL